MDKGRGAGETENLRGTATSGTFPKMCIYVYTLSMNVILYIHTRKFPDSMHPHHQVLITNEFEVSR